MSGLRERAENLNQNPSMGSIIGMIQEIVRKIEPIEPIAIVTKPNKVDMDIIGKDMDIPVAEEVSKPKRKKKDKNA